MVGVFIDKFGAKHSTRIDRFTMNSTYNESISKYISEPVFQIKVRLIVCSCDVEGASFLSYSKVRFVEKLIYFCLCTSSTLHKRRYLKNRRKKPTDLRKSLKSGKFIIPCSK